MKILSLRFQNLNSLEGEWFIDFTHPDYAANGIFAITGPTGAGKTTILDAICLALYGRTPRLGKITENFNEIMSRRQGECSAELLFECAGGRFRAHWSQHRARKKPGAKLQEPRHEIAEAESGRLIESARSRTELEVVKISGMTFDQFTRSILLAQGEFAAFLEADVEDRAGLLEQISGTEIYSRISMAVHSKKNEEWEKLRQATQELAQCPALAEEDAEALKGQREALKNDIAAADTSLVMANQAAARLEKLQILEKKAAELAEKHQELQKDLASFQPDRARLAADRAAAGLDGPHSRLKTLRQQALEKAEELKKLEAGRRPLENALASAAARRETASQALLAARAAETAARPIITQARELDVKIAHIAARLKPLDEERLQAARSLAAMEKKTAQSREALAKIRQESEQVAAALESSASEAALAASLSAIGEKIQSVANLHRRFLGKKAGLKAAEKKFREAGAEFKQADLKHSALKKEAEEKQKERQEALEIVQHLRQKLESLEQRRAELQPGRPCPLCGATEHPWAVRPAAEKMKASDEALDSPLSFAAEAETRLKFLENESAGRDKALEEAALSLRQTELAGERADLELARDKKDAFELAADLEKALADARQAVAPYGSADFGPENTRDIFIQLEAKKNKRQADEARAAQLFQSIKDLERELLSAQALMAKDGEAAARFTAESAGLSDEQSRLVSARRELLGAESPAAREEQLAGTIKAAEGEAGRLEETHSVAARDLEALQTRQIAAGHNLAALHVEIRKAEEHFNSQLPAAGFADEAAFLSAALAPDERARLLAADKALAEAQAVNEAGIRENQAALAAEATPQAGDDKSLPQLREEILHLSETRDRLQAALGVAEQKLKEQLEAAILNKTLLARRERQKNEFDRFNRLHELIGSADGKKYRHFAQGLTFEVMMAQANIWLAQMNDRYILIRDSREPLELSVTDNYQAGEIRSTKNLSGGERFIVSLALALGLSKMAGQNVRVDSLFLDEGFGTLDEDALDTVLEALSSLREHGKLIGVISHVPALTDRIPVQIKITRLPNGLATLGRA